MLGSCEAPGLNQSGIAGRVPPPPSLVQPYLEDLDLADKRLSRVLRWAAERGVPVLPLTTAEDTAVVIDVVENDTDPNGDTLLVDTVGSASNGSVVDNETFGSGNKVLHNIVGGAIGVLEGNGGDLRVGLPMQTLHDGKRHVHEPLRLNALLEAPAEAIEQVQTETPVIEGMPQQ